MFPQVFCVLHLLITFHTIKQSFVLLLSKDFSYESEYLPYKYNISQLSIFATFTVYRRIVKTPATAELATADEKKQVHGVGFFSLSQKTLKIILIR